MLLAYIYRSITHRVHFLDNRTQRYPFPEKASFYGRVVRSVVGVRGVRMNIDDSRLIVRFQRLMTEMLVEKRLGLRNKSPEHSSLETGSQLKWEGKVNPCWNSPDRFDFCGA